jgi:phenylalanyl-tRNA synthetase beta chain
MPTITFSLDDLGKLVKKRISLKELDHLVEYGKGEVKAYDEKLNEAQVNFDDTNLPYLWSVEGFARLLRGAIGSERGIPKFNAKKQDFKVIVESSVKQVRPFIGAFVAKGKKIDDYLLRQIIQLQEKFCESYGRRREKAAIGVYPCGKIKFPVYYKAVNPKSVSFIPLEHKKEMNLLDILGSHPKGKEYAWILKDHKKFPILMDSSSEVLSFPPIINSNESGKIKVGDDNFFVEVTGTDIETVHLAVNIIAQAFYDRGFTIYSAEIKYTDKKISTPYEFNDSVELKFEDVNNMLGTKLTETQIKTLLEKARYNVKGNTVLIPNYRRDIMHPVDVIEDVAITYGFNKVQEAVLGKYTPGETSEIIKFADRCREVMVGLGFQEIMSPILTNKELMFKKMNIDEGEIVEIKDFMSLTFSSVRNWLLPVMMDVLAKNKHAGYPQKVFEQGLVTIKQKNSLQDYERLAAVVAHNKMNFTGIKQNVDYLMKSLGLAYEITDAEHDSFIPGRVGRVIVNGKKVAYIGEISPQVIINFGVEVPVAGFEINLTDLLEASKIIPKKKK